MFVHNYSNNLLAASLNGLVCVYYFSVANPKGMLCIENLLMTDPNSVLRNPNGLLDIYAPNHLMNIVNIGDLPPVFHDHVLKKLYTQREYPH